MGAYEQGLHERECDATVMGSGNGKIVAVNPKATTLQTHTSAPKKELRESLDRWESAIEAGKSAHVPDDVPVIAIDELVELLRAGECALIDVRQQEEKYGNMSDPLPGARSITYMSLLKTPESVVSEISALQRSTKLGSICKHIVCY